MAAIDWNESMYVGIKDIDAQHEKLTGLINDLYDAWKADQDKEILENIIAEMHDYMDYHFSTEQALMEKYEYPNQEEHLDQHNDFIIKTVNSLMAYADDKEDLTDDVLDYLMDWWVNHINGTDKKMAGFLKTKNVQ